VLDENGGEIELKMMTTTTISARALRMRKSTARRAGDRKQRF
jgi:hypothetical protein